jgi:hypothetical protein
MNMKSNIINSEVLQQPAELDTEAIRAGILFDAQEEA